MKNDNSVRFIIGTEVAITLENIILEKILLSDIRKLSPVYQTSTLEAKHSLDVRFVPKNVSFSYNGILMRYDHSCL